MALVCNIDARGKAVRLRIGIVLGCVGLGALALCFFARPPTWGWSLAALCIAAAAFTLFEARAGWCAVRALGLKTPL